MKTRLISPMVALAVWATCLCINLPAQPVTDWHTFHSPATTLSGQGTASPVMGDTTATSSGGFLVGYLNSPLSLPNVGDKITLTFGVRFNDGVGMANGGDNFRFALFDLNGQTNVVADNTATAGVDGATDDWRGYWFGARNGSGTGSGGSIRERIGPVAAGGDNPFSATGGNTANAPSLGAVGGTAVTLSSSTNGTGGPLFTGEMTLTKTASGVDLSGLFSDGSNMNMFSASDTNSPFPANFGAVAFLSGGGLSVDQMLFQDVSVTFTPVPEPSAIILVSVGLLGLFLQGVRSRRRSAAN